MRTLLVLSPKGGSGKSTMARSLAPAAAADGLAVATLDLDPQGTTARWHKVRAERRDEITEVVGFTADIHDGPTACRGVEDADLLIIDTPTAIESYPEAMRGLIGLSDLVLVPTQSSHDDTASVLPIMRTAVVAVGRRGAFVLNRLKPRVAENEAARVRLARVADVLSASLPDSIKVQRATAHGLGITEVGGVGSEEMLSVWAELKRRLEL
jgi:chromosome partitioning protein